MSASTATATNEVKTTNYCDSIAYLGNSGKLMTWSVNQLTCEEGSNCLWAPVGVVAAAAATVFGLIEATFAVFANAAIWCANQACILYNKEPQKVEVVEVKSAASQPPVAKTKVEQLTAKFHNTVATFKDTAVSVKARFNERLTESTKTQEGKINVATGAAASVASLGLVAATLTGVLTGGILPAVTALGLGAYGAYRGTQFAQSTQPKV